MWPDHWPAHPKASTSKNASLRAPPNAQRGSGNHQRNPLRHDQSQDVTLLRAKSHANANFARASRNVLFLAQRNLGIHTRRSTGR